MATPEKRQPGDRRLGRHDSPYARLLEEIPQDCQVSYRTGKSYLLPHVLMKGTVEVQALMKSSVFLKIFIMLQL